MTEWLTDTEKIILLAAISREKEVCIQVDKKSCREPYETSLESVCKSLEHKFMDDSLFKQIRAEVVEEYTNKLEELIRHGIFVSRNGLFEAILAIAEQLKEQNK